jgi:phage shock protein E
MFGALRSMLGGGDDQSLEALKSGAVIIDVRTTAEYSGGHVAGSKNIPLNELPANLSSLSKSTPIVFCCASGARSGSAAKFASDQGFTAFNGGPWTRVNSIVNELNQ